MATKPKTERKVTKVTCECGAEIAKGALVMHQTGKVHAAAMAALEPKTDTPAPIDTVGQVVVAGLTADGTSDDVPELHPTLVNILTWPRRDSSDLKNIAKTARHLFAAQGWPNQEHPGTVRDFLVENEVPIIENDRAGLTGMATGSLV